MAYQDYYYPDALKDTSAFPASIYFAFFDRKSTAESAPADNIHLYMPESFNSSSPVVWDPYKGLTLATQAATRNSWIFRESIYTTNPF